MSAGGRHLKDEGSRPQVVLAGGIAGLVSRFCIAPLDVVKIRLQLQTHALSPFGRDTHGALPVVKKILREEGLTGFWRGNVPAELLYVTYGATQFTTYRSISAILTPVLPSQVTAFISGATAGAIGTTITYPLDLLRTRFAAQGNTRVYSSFRRSFVDIIQTEGFQGLFKGLGAGIGQIVPYMGLFFVAYESLRPAVAGLQLPFGSGDAASGVIAGIIAKTGVFPLDLIRKRLQIQGPSRVKFAEGVVPAYGRGVLKVGSEVVKSEGWRGLYRGLGIGLAKAAPASAITMWTYERALRELRSRGIAENL